MNWKNVTIEPGFIKQETNFNGNNALNYIPMDQIDSFGIVNSENKRWLYMGIFIGALALLMTFSQNVQGTLVFGMISLGFLAVYFLTRKTWFTVTSSQTKFLVQVMTTKEEIQAVNDFVFQIKSNIQTSKKEQFVKAA